MVPVDVPSGHSSFPGGRSDRTNGRIGYSAGWERTAKYTRQSIGEFVGTFEDFFLRLNQGHVRYVVVGGVAVVLHGYPRMTADIDLVVDLEPEAALQTVRILTEMGLRPRVPVDAEEFADPKKRLDWIDQRGMTVFNLSDPDDPLRSVDLFVEPPIPFDELWSRSVMIELPSTEVRVASMDDLITMKKAAGRPEDLADIQALEDLRDGGKTESD